MSPQNILVCSLQHAFTQGTFTEALAYQAGSRHRDTTVAEAGRGLYSHVADSLVGEMDKKT